MDDIKPTRQEMNLKNGVILRKKWLHYCSAELRYRWTELDSYTIF